MNRAKNTRCQIEPVPAACSLGPRSTTRLDGEMIASNANKSGRKWRGGEQLVIAVWVKIFGGMFWYFVVSHPISARSCFSAIFAARVVWFFFFFARWVTLETIQVLFLAPQFSQPLGRSDRSTTRLVSFSRVFGCG